MHFGLSRIWLMCGSLFGEAIRTGEFLGPSEPVPAGPGLYKVLPVPVHGNLSIVYVPESTLIHIHIYILKVKYFKRICLFVVMVLVILSCNCTVSADIEFDNESVAIDEEEIQNLFDRRAVMLSLILQDQDETDNSLHRDALRAIEMCLSE